MNVNKWYNMYAMETVTSGFGRCRLLPMMHFRKLTGREYPRRRAVFGITRIAIASVLQDFLFFMSYQKYVQYIKNLIYSAHPPRKINGMSL